MNLHQKAGGDTVIFFLAVCLATLKFRELIEIILFFLKLLLS